ncbi:leucyl aminopeptidase [Enterobacterales bacterium CwR94]|nr:leucyl aminopeptidase [Enterobacterales bacterium CwR94]
MAQKKGCNAKILIASDNSQESTARAISLYCPDEFDYSFTYLNLESEKAEKVNEYIESSDLFIFMYDSSIRSDINPHGPAFIPPLKQKMAEHWKKSVLLREYGEFFKEAFSEDIRLISARNQQIIQVAKSAQRIAFQDGFGGEIKGTLAPDQAWKSLDGWDHYDLMPGEVATRVEDLSGSLTFGGTFLSTVPFAIKYGVIEPVLHIDIENSRVVNVRSNNQQLEDDFNLYLNRCEGNRVVEEFGIGTNMHVNLHGRNASFEERHAGVHLGLGGGQRASHHLDLVFSSGKLLFDDHVIFDGEFNFGA